MKSHDFGQLYVDHGGVFLWESVVMNGTAFWSQRREALGAGGELKHMDGATLFQAKPFA